MRCHSFDIAANRLATPGQSHVTFSSIIRAEMKGLISPTYSIKWTLAGRGDYYIDREHHSVTSGRYVIVNNDLKLDFSIRGEGETRGFCFHLTPDLLGDVYRSLTRPGAALLDAPFEAGPFPEFHECIYAEGENSLGHYLQYVAAHFNAETGEIGLETDAVYYGLAREMLFLHHLTQEGLSRLTVKKEATKKEVFRRIRLAQTIMQDNPGAPLDMRTLAKEVALSEAHFYRSFRQVVKCTPYQYHLALRLAKAGAGLRTGTKTVTAVMEQYGFTDLPAFSKLFKKAYGISLRGYSFRGR